MQIDIRSRSPERTRGSGSTPFHGVLDLSHLNRWGEIPFPESVTITGTAVDHLDYYEITYEAETVLHDVCARCLEPSAQPIRLSFFHTAMESEPDADEADEFLPVHEGILDVARMVTADLLLETDGTTLCSPDCKGLCPVCGKNCNTAACGCDTSLPDPRFDTLRQFMQETEED